MHAEQLDTDTALLIDTLPERIRQRLYELDNFDTLIDIVLDRGRKPTARFLSGEVVLSDEEVTADDLARIVSQVGNFDEDNRAGIERTLHRIAAIRNRRGAVVGLTCRLGRAVYGTIDIISDLITSGKSVLILGRPGVGKTTMLREAARILADEHRVVIVDTSNEIGGDGDVPHPAVGLARRMQVRVPSLQHEVMIEAVENHTPEVIVIDEIGREQEAKAARTIAERGVQLIGTAHGNSLENLLMNPTIADLVGGIESVTLSDEEARRRGTQKTVLERRAPPTFGVLIELVDRDRVMVHNDVAESVDAMLRGNPIRPEERYRDQHGEVNITPAQRPQTASRRGRRGGSPSNAEATMPFRGGQYAEPQRASRGVPNGNGNGFSDYEDQDSEDTGAFEAIRPVAAYAYGVNKGRLMQAARRLRLPLNLAERVNDADVLVTLKSYYRRNERPISDAEGIGIPIYVLRANSLHQMENFLVDLFDLSATAGTSSDPEWAAAMDETRRAIEAVLNGERSVDLAAQPTQIRRRQHQMARQANLGTQSSGSEPNRRVRIYRQ